MHVSISCNARIQQLRTVYCLQVSTVGIMPFFVENVSTLQLSAMKLIRSVSPLLPISTVTLLASLCCKLSPGVFQV